MRDTNGCSIAVGFREKSFYTFYTRSTQREKRLMTGIGPLLMMAVFMLAIIFGFATIAKRVYNFQKDQRRFKRTLRIAPILTVGDFADGTSPTGLKPGWSARYACWPRYVPPHRTPLRPLPRQGRGMAPLLRRWRLVQLRRREKDGGLRARRRDRSGYRRSRGCPGLSGHGCPLPVWGLQRRHPPSWRVSWPNTAGSEWTFSSRLHRLSVVLNSGPLC